MHQTTTASVAAPIERIAEIIGDLGTYPSWLDLVTAATPDEAQSPDDHPSWLVTIRAKVGPFARSKKLRMVRTSVDRSEAGATFRFERREIDGRNHSGWTLEASVATNGDRGLAVDLGSTVIMDLRYDGGLWTAPLEPILGSIIADAGPGLEAYAKAHP